MTNNKVMKIEDFKVGDKIYEFRYGYVSRVIAVERMTKTMLICDNDRVRLRVDGDWIRSVGNSGYGMSYQVETPELKAKYEQIALMKKVQSSFDKHIDKLDMADLKAIDQILEKYT